MSTVTDRPDPGRPLRRPSSRRRRGHVLLSLCIPLASVAGEAPGAAFDLDRDGRIASEEFRQFLVERIRLPLSALDDDGDGRVSSAGLSELRIQLDSVEEGIKEYQGGLKSEDVRRQPRTGRAARRRTSAPMAAAFASTSFAHAPSA